MSGIRRDKKGRRLERGETQDKEGRYIYSYLDAFKNRKTVKSWRLVESDSLPKGKRPCKPLRELKKEVIAEQIKGIGNNDITVLELVDMYMGNMARKGMNPKTLQYLMGHSDICITYNTYTHLGLADAKKEMDRIAKETKTVRENAWKNRRKKCE